MGGCRMTNAEYYGLTTNGKFTKNIDHIPKKVKEVLLCNQKNCQM